MKNGKAFNTFKAGSTWIRADFHLHTNADREFNYTDEHNGNDFINNYNKKLKEMDIMVGIITNHNKFDLKEYKNLKKKAIKEEIYLLAGIELCVVDGANGVHMLICFDDKSWLDGNNDYINDFISWARGTQDKPSFENSKCKSNKTILTCIQKLNEYHKDFFIMFAHVEQDNGLWSELDGGNIKQLGKEKSFRENVLAFQKVRTNDRKHNIKNWLKDWYPAEVEGSDPKNIGEIGKGDPIFIKIGDFNFKAVKYALLNKEFRVRRQVPITKNSFIKSINFTGGLLDAKTIHFNSNMNNFIGIRGSGKSTLFETIRYGLGIKIESSININDNYDVDYKNGLPQMLLKSGGKTAITVQSKSGKEYTIQRRLMETPVVYHNEKPLDAVFIDDLVIKVLYFGQKDLASVGSTGFTMRLIEKFFFNKTRDINDKINVVKSEVLDIIHELKKSEDLDTQLKDSTRELNTLQEKEKIYKEKGVSEKLEKQNNFDKDFNKLKYIKTTISNLQQQIISVKDYIFDSFQKESQPSVQENVFLFAEVNNICLSLYNIGKDLEQILKKINAKDETMDSMIRLLEDKIDAYKEELAQIKRSINLEEGDPDEFLRISKNINLLKEKIELLNKDAMKNQQTESRLMKKLYGLRDLWEEEYHILKKEIDFLNNKNLPLRIEPLHKADKTDFTEFLKNTFKGSGLQKEHYERIADKSPDPIDIYIKFRDNHADLREVIGTEIRYINFKRIFNENMENLLTYRVPDSFIFYYENKELSKHSLGQRASAIILFLLALEEYDLIMIDQPEDDLDNQTIYENVIKELCLLKDKTQFIFVTHNPNIPVLAEAEQIIASTLNLDVTSDDPDFKLELGSLDSLLIQDRIINIMEGGEEAFQKREKIYKIWNHLNY